MPPFEVGDLVQRVNAPDQIGVIRSVRINPQTNLRVYDVLLGAKVIAIYEENLRPLPQHRSPWDDLRAGITSGDKHFRTSMTRHRVLHSPSRIAKSFSSARTQFYPHQFKPLLKLLDSPHKRLLIADDVGLGKTIEAGYILLELEAEKKLPHVLVVAPSRLLPKWKDELEKRFDQKFDVVNRAAVVEFLRREAPDTNFRWLASYETLRMLTDEIKSSALSLDCLFFDEAHRLRNPESKTHAVGELLCERSESVVMLSATPIQTGISDLHALARLLLPEEFVSSQMFFEQMEDNRLLIHALNAMRAATGNTERAAEALQKLDLFLETETGRSLAGSPALQKARSLLLNSEPSREELTAVQSTLAAMSPIGHFFTRTRKVDAIPDTPKREALWLAVELTPEEQSLYDFITSICRERATQTGWGADQSATMMYRAIASSIPAAIRHFREDLQAAAQPVLSEELEEVLPFAVADINTPNSLRAEIRQATHLFKKLGATDSKFGMLSQNIFDLWKADEAAKRPKRKCIVFSYFRGTVEYLRQELKKNCIDTACVHGGMPIKERTAALDPFKDRDDVNVLVTSDVSAEGVDLQMAAVVFNYDLPWNPMVVEQRIGRIDRIGQTSKVLTIASMVVKGSVEEKILQRLFMRIKLIESSIGEIGEILGDEVGLETLTQQALLGELSDEEIERQLKRAENAFNEQRQAAAELDRRAVELVAIDQAILDEIQAASGEHQIPNERHLLEFVNETLSRHATGAVIASSALHGRTDVDLRRALSISPFEARDTDTERARQFMQRAEHGSVKVTFSREIAYRYPNVEIIHATHPLVRWAAGTARPDVNAFGLSLDTSAALRPGDYLWGISFMESSGSSLGMKMIGVFLPLNDSSFAIRAPSEVALVVGELLDKGREVYVPWKNSTVPPGLEETLTTLQNTLDETSAELNQREKDLFDLRETARVARQRLVLESALKRAEKVLEKYRQRNAAPFAQRMQESKVRKALDRLQEFERTTVSRPWKDFDRTDVAVGYLRVGGANACHQTRD
jgi:SNF2 family DNA or RNA helicase